MVFYQVPCVFNVLVTFYTIFLHFRFFLLLPKREGKDIRVEVKFPKVIALVRCHPCFLKIVVRKRTLDIVTKNYIEKQRTQFEKKENSNRL